MKTYLPFALLFCLACAGKNDTQTDETAALKAAIENETMSFLKVDKEAWAAAWVHAPHAYWSYSDSTGTSFMNGWANIEKSFDGYFKTQVAHRNIDVASARGGLEVERDWEEFRVYGTGAYVKYSQRVKDNEVQRDETSQVRILEKVEGKWLVTYVGIIAKYPE